MFAQGETLCGNLQVRSRLVSCKWIEFDSIFLKQGLVFQGKEHTSGNIWDTKSIEDLVSA